MLKVQKALHGSKNAPTKPRSSKKYSNKLIKFFLRKVFRRLFSDVIIKNSRVQSDRATFSKVKSAAPNSNNEEISVSMRSVFSIFSCPLIERKAFSIDLIIEKATWSIEPVRMLACVEALFSRCVHNEFIFSPASQRAEPPATLRPRS